MLGARGALGQYAIGQHEAASGAYSLAADDGAYTLTGQEVTLRSGRVLTADAGAYTLTGQDATLSRDRRLACATGTYTLSGQSASVVATRTLVASPNTREAATTYQYVMFAALGQVALGGSASADVSAPAVTYSLQGHDTQLRLGFNMQANAGAYAISGQDAGQRFTRAIIANVGAYTLSGQAALSIITMPAGAGSYTLTGQDVSFSRVSKRIRGFARVGPAINARAA